MKVKWTLLVDEMRGSVDKKHYARHIPGNGEWAAVCAKPELSKTTKKSKADSKGFYEEHRHQQGDTS